MENCGERFTGIIMEERNQNDVIAEQFLSCNCRCFMIYWFYTGESYKLSSIKELLKS